jgi:hypothetical protein
MKSIWFTLALAAAAPAVAQTAPAPAAAVDAAALNAARPVIDKLWPIGTYRRLMDGTMSKMMDAMMEQMFQMRAADLVPPGTKGADKVGNKSMAEIAAETDPHFRERMRISTNVMFQEIIPIFYRLEPQMRGSLAQIYANKFTVAQLNDLNAFLNTPTGQIYGREWMLSFMDPRMMTAMQSATPELVKAMPTIMRKVAEATKHLPPPPKKPSQ